MEEKELPPLDTMKSVQMRYSQAYMEWIEAIHTQQLQQGKTLEKIAKDINTLKNIALFFLVMGFLGFIVISLGL